MGARHSSRRRFRRPPTSRTPFDLSVWPFSSPFRRTPAVVTTHSARSVLRWGRMSWPPVDPQQDFLEQFSRHRDLGHLKDGVSGVPHDLGPDIDQILPEAGRRPLCDRLGQGQRSHEVGEIVG